MFNQFKGKTVIFDGGTGTNFIAKGLGFDCAERLNLTHPGAVAAAAEEYAGAGADVILTNTFGASLHKLKQFGLEGKLNEIVSSAVASAKAAVGDGRKFVCGSAGSTGELPFPLGSFRFEDYYDALFPLMRALFESGADAVLIETQVSLLEAKAALRAARDAGGRDWTAGISFTFENGRTLLGMPPEVAAAAAESLGADFAGVNCVTSPAAAEDIIRRYRAYTRLPILAKPNAGLPQKGADGKLVYPLSPEEFAAASLGLVRAGASVIGGCCGTDARHISALAKSLGGEISAPIFESAAKPKPVPIIESVHGKIAETDHDNIAEAAHDTTVDTAPKYICSERALVPLSAAENAESLPPDADDIIELASEDPEALLRIDFSRSDEAEIRAFFDETAGLINCPLCFDAREEHRKLIDRLYSGVTVFF